ncbi:MAG: thiolase family protein, partial [Acidimicrobiales bacterium]|nr:thiolase family protein [Acidimicrobiales bacterium]
MREAVIVEAIRTPIGRRGGSLSDTHPVDLSAHVLNSLLKRTGVEAALVDDVIWGCATQISDQAGNVGRFAVLAAGWPETIPGVTINRACGSSQQALEFAAMGVMSGRYDLVVAGGVESMSRVPLGSARAVGEPYGPAMCSRYDHAGFDQGIGAEMIAERWGLSRQQLDEFSVGSHLKAAAATDRGAFEEQVVPVKDDPAARVDEGIRRDTSVEKLSGLKPAFREGGVIHAGNSSQISDGAAGVMI